jgi:hypothetical protein
LALAGAPVRRYFHGLKTALLLGLLTELVMVAGEWLGGRTG